MKNENSFTIEEEESNVSIVKREPFVPRFAVAVHPSSAFIGACLPTSLALELWGVQDAWKMKVLLRFKGEAFVPRFALAVHPSSAFIGACLPTSLALELWGVQDAWKMKILLRSRYANRAPFCKTCR